MAFREWEDQKLDGMAEDILQGRTQIGIETPNRPTSAALMNRKGKWYNRLAVPVAKSSERPKQDEYHGEETFKNSMYSYRPQIYL